MDTNFADLRFRIADADGETYGPTTVSATSPINNHCVVIESLVHNGDQLTVADVRDGLREGWLGIEKSTGIKDVNGKEIFEGDIVRANGFNRKVVWSEKEAGFGLYEIHEGGLSNIPISRFKKMEIVGDIHRTPELWDGIKYEKR